MKYIRYALIYFIRFHMHSCISFDMECISYSCISCRMKYSHEYEIQSNVFHTHAFHVECISYSCIFFSFSTCLIHMKYMSAYRSCFIRIHKCIWIMPPSITHAIILVMQTTSGYKNVCALARHCVCVRERMCRCERGDGGGGGGEITQIVN